MQEDFKMPIQIQEITDENKIVECPLCLEPLEIDDINFFPCACGYQICRFCWHRIRTDENGLCPACRTSYPENPVEFKPLTGSDLQKLRQEKRQKEVQRRKKLSDCRRHLGSVRVLQKNLVFVVGLSQCLADVEMLKQQEYFGKYGKIIKVVINSNTTYAGSQGPSCSAYVTYSKMEEALLAIQSVNNVHVEGRTLKASLGTTKYCSTYLRNQQCHKTDCMYLHELADDSASFTKDDMQAGKHQEFEQKLLMELLSKSDDNREDVTELNENEIGGKVHDLTGGERGCQLDPDNSQAWPYPSQTATDKDAADPKRQPSSTEDGTVDKRLLDLTATDTSPRHAKKQLFPDQHPTVLDHHSIANGDVMGLLSSESSSAAGDTPPPPVSAVLLPARSESSAEIGTEHAAENRENMEAQQRASSSSLLPTIPPLFIGHPDAHHASTNPGGDNKLGEFHTTTSYPSAVNQPPLHNNPLQEAAPSGDRLFPSSYDSGLSSQNFVPFHRPSVTGEEQSNIPTGVFGHHHAPLTSWQHQAPGRGPPVKSSPASGAMLSSESVVRGDGGKAVGWETAFGFVESPRHHQVGSGTGDATSCWTTSAAQRHDANDNDPVDDELGFDPWAECNKGFAEIIQTETYTRTAPGMTRARLQSPAAHATPSLDHHAAMGFHHQDNSFSLPNQLGGVKMSAPSPSRPSAVAPFTTIQQHQRVPPPAPGYSLKDQQQQQVSSSAEWQNGFRALFPASVKVNFATADNNNGQRTAPSPAHFEHRSRFAGGGVPVDAAASFPRCNYNQWSAAMSHQHQQQPLTSQLSLLGLANHQHRASAAAQPPPPPPGLRGAVSAAAPAFDPAIIAQVGVRQHNQTPPSPGQMEETPHWMKSLQMLTADTDGSLSPTIDHDVAASAPAPVAAHHLVGAGLPRHHWPVQKPMGGAGAAPPPGFPIRYPYHAADEYSRHQGLLENQS